MLHKKSENPHKSSSGDLLERLFTLEKADVVLDLEIQDLKNDFEFFFKRIGYNENARANKKQFFENKLEIIQAKLGAHSGVERMPSIHETIKEVRLLLQGHSEQLVILSKYTVHENDRTFIQTLAKKINAYQNIDQEIEQELATIENIRFEGKGGTKNESTFLSDTAYSLVRFALDALNFLISLATFGKTDKFFTKAPTEEEHKIITKKKDLLMDMHTKLKLKFDVLFPNKDDGLIHDRIDLC